MSETPVTSACVEFRETLARHIKELTRADPERHGTAWYFLRYLQRVAKRAHASPKASEASGAMRGLTRFYVDSAANDADLSARFDDVLAAHRHALRVEHSTPADGY
ncbi:MAG: hypothetical protein IT492_06625 [Gammaproteobacteria bacterium]|nr:hypothetical protein [Gammaproteobacteria bacterium]